MASHSRTLQLVVKWQFGAAGFIESGKLSLINHSGYSLENAKLCLSGLVRITDKTPVAGAGVFEHLSNYVEFTPLSDKPPRPNSPWQIDIGEPDYPMRHYTEGFVSAFLSLSSGELIDVPIVQSAVQQGAEKFEPNELIPKLSNPSCDNNTYWNITPYPNDVNLLGCIDAPTGMNFSSSDSIAQTTIAEFVSLAERLFPDEHWYKEHATSALDVRFSHSVQFSAEQYCLTFDEHCVTVLASTSVGYLYALITLGQLLRAATNNSSIPFPAGGEINDQPMHVWRGCHLDVARQFYEVQTIEQFLCVLAWNKLNRFHWHLSDDEAWRVEIKAYPELTDIGAWRGVGLPISPVLGTGSKTVGGFYTQQQIGEVVRLARKLGISVVPELDMPGHCYAALQSIDELADPEEPESYRSLQGFPNNCLNPKRAQTYTFIEQVLNELLPLFPDNYWHVGADEVPDTAWHAAPSVISDSNVPLTARSLQASFLQKLQAMLDQRGVTTGAWQEAAIEGGINTQGSYLVAWLDTNIAKELAGSGYNVVVSAGQAYYLDMAMDDDWSEPGLAWAGSVSLEQTYEFDPLEGWSDALTSRCMGVQACIWSEQMTSPALFNYLVFPRLSAMAETAWTQKSNKDWNRFSSLCDTMPRLYKL